MPVVSEGLAGLDGNADGSFYSDGNALTAVLAEGRNVYCFGIGGDHLFAEELTARPQGHDEVIGLFPQ